ncbi:hypothetical protein J9332_40210, partial [Aquimarina celericrescens]|nr:hypothetical protein [Aquimarina celericrescens]
TNYKDTLIARFKDQYKDSLLINSTGGSILAPNKNYIFSANTPLDSINEKLISLTDKDTLDIPFSIVLDTYKNEAELTFEKTENNAYQLQFLP